MSRASNLHVAQRHSRHSALLRAGAATLFLTVLAGAQSLHAGLEQRLLAAHNRERAALNLPPLRWNAQLADDAMRWSGQLAAAPRLEHEGGDAGSGPGENVWMGTAGRFAPEAMVGDWVEEKAHFTRGTFPRVSRTGAWTDVAHYTQIVWRDTSEVGCAVARGRQMDVLVCRYARPGNVMGQTPF